MAITPQLDDLLLVVDMQYDFLPGGSLAVAGGDEIIILINRLGRQFKHVVMTQDWHTAGHVSFSRTGTPEGDTTKTVTCPIRRLSTLMQDLGHTRIDVLKMDIEGFEYAVVEDLIAGTIRPRQLLIEFHHNMYSHSRSDTERSVAMILAAGYELFWVSNVGHEYAFVAGASVH